MEVDLRYGNNREERKKKWVTKNRKVKDNKGRRKGERQKERETEGNRKRERVYQGDGGKWREK